MNNEVITDKQAITLLVMIMLGSTLVNNVILLSGKNFWISVGGAIIISILFAAMYARIISCCTQRDLYGVLEKYFGKLIANVVLSIYVWHSLLLSSFIIREFGEFIITVTLPETPMIVPIIMLGIVSILGVKMGIEVLGRCAVVFFIVLGAIFFIATILLIPEMSIEKMSPIFYISEDFKSIYKNSIVNITFPYTEIFLFTLFSSSLKKDSSTYKVFVLPVLIGGLMLLCIGLNEFLVLGVNRAQSLYFPSYVVVGRIDLRAFIQRVEVLVGIFLLFGIFLKTSIILFVSINGLSRLFNIKGYKIIALPMGILSINLSIIVFDSIMKLGDWALEIWPYYAGFLQVILPAFILIWIEIKKKISKGLND